MKLYINVVFFDHLMLQVPPRASAQLRHNRIAFPEHIDIEIDVLAGLSERFSTRCESRRDHEIGGGNLLRAKCRFAVFLAAETR